MNDPNLCRVKFDVSDFTEEERLLTRKHAEGKAFSQWSFGNRLSFVDCAPVQAAYRLDFPGPEQNREKWLSQLSSRGWEYCGKLHSWDCLRRAGPADCAEELAAGLFHNDLERGRRGRARAEREMVIGVIPMAIFFVACMVFKNTEYTLALQQLAMLFLVVAAAVALPAFRVRSKCGAVMLEWEKAKKKKEQTASE